MVMFSHNRYVCGVAECNYLTVDEAMLRCHLKALHSEELYFRCPHCPQLPPGQEGLNIAIDKMGVHLKMHDTRLYKCSHCNHHHYHRYNDIYASHLVYNASYGLQILSTNLKKIYFLNIFLNI